MAVVRGTKLMWQNVASGDLSNIGQLPNYEGQVTEGLRGSLVLGLRLVPPLEYVQRLQAELVARGVAEATTTLDGNNLTITYRKGFPWLAVIVAAVLAVLILAVLIVAWQLYREVSPVIGITTGPLLILGAVAVIMLVVATAYFIWRKGR